MEGFLMLFMLSLTMFIGSYISGSVPLAMSFSESKLRLVTVFGAGLLVGTALAVIIPEGVQTIYEAEHDPEHQQPLQIQTPSPHIMSEKAVDSNTLDILKIPMPADQQGGQNPPKGAVAKIERHQNADAPADQASAGDRARRKRSVAPGEQGGKTRISRDTHKHEDDHKHEDPHHHGHDHESEGKGKSLRIDNMIGMALVFGFVFMLCVDQIGHASQRQSGGVQPRYKITATLGLVVHAAADGIALGAASTTNQTEIQFIVFLAIMLHKAPAAFGLSTFLMYEGLETARIRRHLLVFALAAPVAAVFTFICIVQGGSRSLSSQTSTGVLMLFSAGTFLYVATVHVLPELVQQGQQQAAAAYSLVADTEASTSAADLLSSPTKPKLGSISHGHSHGSGSPAFKLNELFALIVGAVVPVFLSLGHSHSH